MRKEKIIPYPCEVKQGDKIRIADGSTRIVGEIDGRFILFTDGAKFSITHPDILGVVSEKKKNKEEQEQNIEE
jgi:hypothetical protein